MAAIAIQISIRRKSDNESGATLGAKQASKTASGLWHRLRESNYNVKPELYASMILTCGENRE